jgi:hypothetical protein
MVRAFGNNRDRPHLFSHKTWSVPYFPLLELTDNLGNEVLFQVEMAQEKMQDTSNGLLFHFLMTRATMIRIIEEETPTTETAPSVTP